MLPSTTTLNRRSPPPPITMEQMWSEINLDEIGAPTHTPSPRGPSPATVLTLNSIPDLLFPTEDGPRVGAGPFDALLPSSVIAPFGKKRPPGNGNGERRYKRMMKNRESASRSRARKQAYVSGLQMKIAHLVEENDKLKDQLKKMAKMQDEAAHQHPRKNLLPRTKSAPF